MKALLCETHYFYIVDCVLYLNITHGLRHFISAAELLRDRSTILRNTYFPYFVIIATDYTSCEERAEGEETVDHSVRSVIFVKVEYSVLLLYRPCVMSDSCLKSFDVLKS